MSSMKKNPAPDYLAIEREARRLRAEAAVQMVQALGRWIARQFGARVAPKGTHSAA